MYDQAGRHYWTAAALDLILMCCFRRYIFTKWKWLTFDPGNFQDG